MTIQAFFFGPDDYAKPFFPVGQRLIAQAEHAVSKGSTGEARDLFSTRGGGLSDCAIPDQPVGSQPRSLENCKAAYERGGQLLNPPSIPVAVPFTRADTSAGDRDVPIQAYLRLPKGTKPETGWPVLLFICGLDAYKTDNSPRTQTHVDRCCATVIFEIPGTGDCPAAANEPTSPDRLMSSIIDWVLANADRYKFDEKKIVARGISRGGYYAFRVAHTHGDRLLAVVAQGGGCHHMFDVEWIHAQNQMEYPFALADALAYKFGYHNADSATAVARYVAESHKFSLVESGMFGTPTCRLLAINGMEDSIFPIEDSLIIATQGKNKDLVARGNRSHMGDPGAEGILYRWIDDVIAGRP